MTAMVCEECGSDGEDGEIEYADGRVCHFRKPLKDGRIHPVLCSGRFVRREIAEELGARE